MTVDTKVATAYATMNAFETQQNNDASLAVDTIIDAIAAFNTTIEAIIARYPDTAKTCPSYQRLLQGHSSIVGNWTLNNLRATFGIAPAPAPVAPTSTPEA